MVYKYFLKTFYNKINKKKYNLQIWQYNIWHTNIIAIKIVIILAKKSKDKEKPLAIKNIDKIAIAKIIKLSSVINFNNKYSWVISNGDIDVIKKI